MASYVETVLQKTYFEIVKEAIQCKKDNYKVEYSKIPEKMDAAKKNWEALKGKATEADLNREVDYYIGLEGMTNAATKALQTIAQCYEKTIVECQLKPLDRNTLQELQRFGAKLDAVEERRNNLVKKIGDFKQEKTEITFLKTKIEKAFADAQSVLEDIAYALKGSIFSFGSIFAQIVEKRKRELNLQLQLFEGEKKTV